MLKRQNTGAPQNVAVIPSAIPHACVLECGAVAPLSIFLSPFDLVLKPSANRRRRAKLR